MEKIIDLSSFANGAVAERLNYEISRVLENIVDPNTDPNKVRKLTLTLNFKADDKRDLTNVSIVAKPTLAPAKPIETKIVMDYDAQGRVTGAELKSGVKGQTYITNEGEVAEDTGKVINLKNTQGGTR
jgi:metal-sulfur cluster biosynthetic enzyme